MTDREPTEQILADDNRRLEIELARRTIELSEISHRLALEIEERQQAEKKLRQERELNLTLLENCPNFLVAIDPEGRERGEGRKKRGEGEKLAIDL